MGSEKPGSEILQNAFLHKEGPHRNKEGWEGASEICIAPYNDCPFKLSAEGKQEHYQLSECGWTQGLLQLWKCMPVDNGARYIK